MHPSEPTDSSAFTRSFDSVYTRFGRSYDFLVRHTPVWHWWVAPAIPHIRGPRVLEISFGTGWLLGLYAGRFDTFGIDLNREMLRIASRNLARAHLAVPLQRGNVEALPYRSESFDSVVNTMAFSGYPRAEKAMAEIARVIRPGGRLILVDIGPPPDGNLVGRALIRLWVATGDIVRAMGPILEGSGFEYDHQVIAGLGTVHLYIATKSQ